VPARDTRLSGSACMTPAPRSWRPSRPSSTCLRCWSTTWVRRPNGRPWRSSASCWSRWSRRPAGRPTRSSSGSGRCGWCSAKASWSASTATRGSSIGCARTSRPTLSWPPPARRRCCPVSSTTPWRATAPSWRHQQRRRRGRGGGLHPWWTPADRAHLPPVAAGAGAPAGHGSARRDAGPPGQRVAVADR